MPYNGSGSYTLSDTIQPNTPGDANEVQAILDDIATALNVAFCRDGQAAMSAPLKLAAGSVSAPSLCFSADTGVGFYRQAAGNLSAAAGGSEIVRISTTGLDLRSGSLSIGGTAGLDTSNIRDNAVTDAKLRDSAALSVIGRATNTAGDPADIAAATDGHVLRRSGTSLGFGTLASGAFADNTIAYSRLATAATATQSDMEAASATNLIVTPGRQHFHPSAAKAWIKWHSSGTTILISYNITSVVNNGVGDETINFATSFSSTNYCILGTAGQADPGNEINGTGPRPTDIGASSCRVFTRQGAAPVDTDLFYGFFGDQ